MICYVMISYLFIDAVEMHCHVCLEILVQTIGAEPENEDDVEGPELVNFLSRLPVTLDADQASTH